MSIDKSPRHPGIKECRVCCHTGNTLSRPLGKGAPSAYTRLYLRGRCIACCLHPNLRDAGCAVTQVTHFPIL